MRTRASAERRTAAGGAEIRASGSSRFASAPRVAAQRANLDAMFGAARANRTGLPDRLKAGVEALSGLPLDHVRVHFNSSRPASLGAAAYTQGADIHLAPGQERHLAHEAWHVVQQAQGRVRPTRQFAQGVPINDDDGLEREASVMGARAAGAYSGTVEVDRRPGEAQASSHSSPVQFGPNEANAWRRAKGYNTRMAFIDALVELFDGGPDGARTAWALILEHNELADHHLHTIKPADVRNYQEPAEEPLRSELRRLAKARTYLRDQPVAPGDLVYGVGESRDPYVDSRRQPGFNVIDDLNALFLGTRAGESYQAGAIPGLGERGQRAGDFREFMHRFGPKDPQQTPGGDAFSINARLRRASKYGIAFTAGRGNRIRFALDRLNQGEVVGKSRPDDTGSTAAGNKMRAITGSELRYIYRRRHDPAFMAAIEFYRDGYKLDAAPWEENPQIWADYSPRQERSPRWQIIRNVESNVHHILNSLPNRWRFTFRPFARAYVNTFIATFDAMFADQDLDAIGEQIIEAARQDFFARIQALKT